MEFVLNTITPIEKPKKKMIVERLTNDKFLFDIENRFVKYTVPTTDLVLYMDDSNNWYLSKTFNAKNLTEIKYARQAYKPSYITSEDKFPLISYMMENGLNPSEQGYDKAFAHLGVFTNDILALSERFQSQCANIDGEDDPQVVHSLHFLSTFYNNLETRFITGWETNSFSTITENEYYYKNIHLRTTAEIYLLFFVYLINYKILPSNQMLPKLLGNLWRSGMVDTTFNALLHRIEKINK
ncbi:hypothetical protein [Paenibacillus sp. NPDC058174]|uniref:hypothetical protein n=1 Tax=Paenibacillus sp. NPDC058174 TaxID=3346366 RepID=UPI0036DA68CA